MRDLWGFPPSKNEVLEEIRVDDIHSDWDYIVHIHEGTEQYLGTSSFLSLKERFNKIQDIEACKHEDREIFLIRTKTLSISTPLANLWLCSFQCVHHLKQYRAGLTVRGL